MNCPTRNEIRVALTVVANSPTPERLPNCMVVLRAYLETFDAEHDFLDAAMEWGANSIKWDTLGVEADPDEARVLRKDAQEICVKMDSAYRRLISKATSK